MFLCFKASFCVGGKVGEEPPCACFVGETLAGLWAPNSVGQVVSPQFDKDLAVPLFFRSCRDVPETNLAIFVHQFVHMRWVQLGSQPLNACLFSGSKRVRLGIPYQRDRHEVVKGVGCFPPAESYFAPDQSSML